MLERLFRFIFVNFCHVLSSDECDVVLMNLFPCDIHFSLAARGHNFTTKITVCPLGLLVIIYVKNFV